MSKYRVVLKREGIQTLTIDMEADSEEEARTIAEEDGDATEGEIALEEFEGATDWDVESVEAL